MNSQHSGDRLRQYLTDHGIRPSEFAAQLQVDPQRLNNWFNRGVAKGELLRVTSVLGLTPEWLEFGTGSPHKQSNNQAELAGFIEPWDSGTPLDDDEVELPFFTEVELSAGNGSTQVVESHGPKLRFAKSTLRRVGVQPQQAACVTVTGDSMAPMLNDGVVVGVNLGETKIKDGSIYALDQEGMLKVKMLHRLPGGGLRIRSLNRDDYPDEDYDASYFAEHVKILGKIFWYSGLIY